MNNEKRTKDARLYGQLYKKMELAKVEPRLVPAEKACHDVLSMVVFIRRHHQVVAEELTQLSADFFDTHTLNEVEQSSFWLGYHSVNNIGVSHGQ